MFAFFETWFMQLQENKFQGLFKIFQGQTKILTPLVKLNFFNTPLAKTRQEGMEGFFVEVFKCKS